MRARTHIRLSCPLVFFLCVPLSAFAATDITSDITSDTEWTADKSPYVVNFDSNPYFPHILTVTSGVTLTIDPGVVIKFGAYNGITVNGVLHAEGTADNPIIFTSLNDDSVGGDTNGDGSATVPVDEQWMHLQFNTGSSGVLDYAIVRYGGEHRTLVSYTGIENSGGTLAVDHSIIMKNGYDGLGQYGGHTILTNSRISNQTVGTSMSGGTLDVNGTRIYENAESGINHYWDGALSIVHSEIDHNGTGITADSSGSIMVSNSSIHDNADTSGSLGIDNESQTIAIDARNNWWGDKSGPFDPTGNPIGTGNGVYGSATYAPWLTSDPLSSNPCAVPGACASNVLFLPGIEGSRLYRPDYNGGTDKLWEPNIDGDVRDLYMNADGSSARFDVYAKERSVIDELPNGENIYKSFIGKMNELKANGTISDWEPVAYDWRLSLDDILKYGNDVQGRIYYSGDLRATSTPYIIQELKRLAASSKTGKVTIIAHSNGGLLAKRLTESLGFEESARLIDKIIFVAVPQAGTPVAVAAGLHGYKQDNVLGFVTSKNTARTFASNSPMEYQLLPSAQYFTYMDDPVVTFDASLTDWISRYGSTVHSEGRLFQFLTDTYGRVDPQAGDTNQPIQLNASLFSNAETLHTDLDNWTPPAGISLVQIAGWGIPETVEGITYKKKGAGVTPEADFTIDGDGTVVVPSALWTSTTTGAVNYWVDLDSYNKKHPVVTWGGLRPFDHSKILETDPVLNFISDQVASISNPLADYVYLSTDAPAEVDNRLRYALHSPLTLNLYDALGRHTGVSTSTGQIEEQIPGTYYTEFGDVKYIFSDASTTAHIVMNGYATGTFIFNVDQYNGDMLTASTTFKDIPTSTSTTVALDVQSDISTLSPMRIDKNGDGTIDATLAPELNDIVTFDATPPELRITFSTTTKSIAFIGTDDSGATTMTTSTHPTLKANQKKEPEEGEGEKYRNDTTTVTVRDAAGNTTALVYTGQLQPQKQQDAITLRSLAYNGATTTISSTALSYQWENGRGGFYQDFSADMRVASTTLESHYQQKKNQTTIMTKPQDFGDSDKVDRSDVPSTKRTLPGMVIPYITTQKGSVIIGY